MTGTAVSQSSREAQKAWAGVEIRTRLRVIRSVRHSLAVRGREFAALIPRDPAETLVAEVLPLAEACLFLERNAEKLLRARHMGSEGRPLWLAGVELEARREPLGTVLVIGPSNYPLFLPGVQVLQALAAGNAVLVKPGRGGFKSMELLANCLRDAGLDMRLFQVLGEAPQEAEEAMEAGVDKVFLTGSNATGTAVLSRLARYGTPSVMELSGDDAVFVRPGADLNLVEKAVRFGVAFNGGNTCIAPKRVFAPAALADQLRGRLEIPVIAAEDDAAIGMAEDSGYGLGASVFGPPEEAAMFARRLTAGVVVINDMIVPTADPRMAFGGRRRSGFGLTRGAEGLLEMTALKTIVVRRRSWFPGTLAHLEARHAVDAELFTSFLALLHGGSMAVRWRGLREMLGAAMRRR